MSAVMRGSGAVFGPLCACQSTSASTRLPRSARSRNTPLQDEHWATKTSPTDLVDIADWHFGQVISSMAERYRPRPDALATPDARPRSPHRQPARQRRYLPCDTSSHRPPVPGRRAGATGFRPRLRAPRWSLPPRAGGPGEHAGRLPARRGSRLPTPRDRRARHRRRGAARVPRRRARPRHVPQGPPAGPSVCRRGSRPDRRPRADPDPAGPPRALPGRLLQHRHQVRGRGAATDAAPGGHRHRDPGLRRVVLATPDRDLSPGQPRPRPHRGLTARGGRGPLRRRAPRRAPGARAVDGSQSVTDLSTDPALGERRREQRAWYWYDWANSAYTTTVGTVLFAPYLTSVAETAACGAPGTAQNPCTTN